MTTASSMSASWVTTLNRNLIETMPMAVYACDADGVLVAYNMKAAVLWGVTPTLGDSQQKFCGAHRLYLADGTFVPHDQTPLASVARTKQPVAFEAIVGRPDGTLRHVSANVAPLFGEDGTYIGFINCVLDVTDSKRTAASQERTWMLSQDVMLTATHAGEVVTANPAWAELLERPPSSSIGAHIADFLHNDDAEPFSKKLSATAAGFKAQGLEARLVTGSGGHRWLSWNMTADSDYVYAVGRDVTAEKTQAQALATAESALRQSQRMEAIGQLTGGVAHDFNNLLTVIKGSADALQHPGLPEDRRSKFVAAISKTADRGARLTSQLLAFSRRQALRAEVFDVGESVLAIGDMLETLTGSRIRLELLAEAGVYCVNTDQSQLDIAIVNMVANARDSMSGIGTIRIAVGGALSVPKIRSHAERQGSFVTITVSDTGTGISAEHLDHIFEPFFTTKDVGQGTGLGLSQVFGFTKQTGGEVVVESEVGRGAVFTLYIPRVFRDDKVAGARSELAPARDPGQACVLIVEDNDDVRRSVDETLQELGFKTIVTSSAAEALVAIAGNAPAIDVVFTDVEMPGMNGIELAAEIRRMNKSIPIVLTSGYSHALSKGDTRGFELVKKPYSVEQLARTLLSQIRSKPTEGSDSERPLALHR